jgi:hypothetical protein
VAVSLLAACDPPIPDSAAGVGFDSSLGEQRAREAALQDRSSALPPPSAISSEPISPTPAQAAATQVPTASRPAPPTTGSSAASRATPAATTATRTADDIARETAAALAAAQANSGQLPLEASPSNPAPRVVSNPGISDENDFQAVSSRQSIESDAARLAALRAQRQEVQPTALPRRSNGDQPNIVRYALETSNPRGQRIYRRVGLNLEARAQRNCAGYASADQAQLAFLSKGGPQRDRLNLDPDGDGYACAWDPTPFRNAARN